MDLPVIPVPPIRYSGATPGDRAAANFKDGHQKIAPIDLSALGVNVDGYARKKGEYMSPSSGSHSNRGVPIIRERKSLDNRYQSSTSDISDTLQGNDMQPQSTFVEINICQSIHCNHSFSRLASCVFDNSKQEFKITTAAINNENDAIGVVNSLKAQCTPDQIIVSSAMPGSVLQSLHDPINETSIECLRQQYFSSRKGKEEIMERYFKCADYTTLINAEDKCVISACCGMLNFLEQCKVLPSFRHIDTSSPDHGDDTASLKQQKFPAKTFSIDKCMFLDQMCLRSLNIFATDIHPNQYVKNRSKEGLSLYGLVMAHTQSKLGEDLARRWLLRPSLDHAVLNARYEATEIITKPINVDAYEQIRKELNGLRNVSKLLKRLEEYNSNNTLKDWHLLWSICSKAMSIRNLARRILHSEPRRRDVPEKQPEDAPSKSMVCSTDTVEFYDAQKNIFTRLSSIPNVVDNVHRWIQGIVDFKRSQDEGRVVPNRNLDENLDGWRKIYDTLDVFLTSIAEEIAASLDFGGIENEGIEMEVEYIPQIGYVIVFMGLKEHHMALKGDENDRPNVFVVAESVGMEFQFRHDTEESGISLFYKNARMRELDDYFGDVRSIVIDMENSLTRQLHHKVLQYKNVISAIGDILAETDVLMAFASISQTYRCVKPILTKENCFIAENGRHILQETALNSDNNFVPNDTVLYPDKQHAIMVVTGPNSSGKSVYLKQVGLIAVLAHVGCYVPCTNCKIGPIDRIFTRISTVESSMIGQSAFTIDLMQVSNMLTLCTNKSLLLIDEFGKGTSNREGPALLASVVCHLDKMSTKCVLSTHFWEIFQLQLLNSCANVKTFAMKLKIVTKTVMVNGGKITLSNTSCDNDNTHDNILDDFVPLFKLELKTLSSTNPEISEGSLNSFGLVCAQMAGIDSGVVRRAAAIRSAIMNGDKIISIESQKNQIYDILMQTSNWENADDSTVIEIVSMLQSVL